MAVDPKRPKPELLTNTIPPAPILFARTPHVKSVNHRITELKRTQAGVLGKRPSSYEMKVTNFDAEYAGKTKMMEEDRLNEYDWVCAVRNRRTGQILFTPFEFVNFLMKAPKLVKKDEPPEDPEELRRRLIMEFGSKKSKAQLMSSLRNAVDEKATSQLFSHAMNYMKETDEAKRAKLAVEQNVDGETSTTNSPSKHQISAALPPCNLDATKPSDIYDIKDIVQDELLEILKPEAERFLLMTPKEVKDEGHSALVMAIIQMSSSIKDLDQRTIRVAYCLYLSYLIRLNKLVGGRVRYITPSALTENGSIPQSIVGDLINKFTSVGGAGDSAARSWKSAAKLTVSALHKDILLSRIAVLLLILSDHYAFNINKAVQDLGGSEGKVSEAKLTSICKALGCRMERRQRSGEPICVLDKPPKQKSALTRKQAFSKRR